MKVEVEVIPVKGRKYLQMRWVDADGNIRQQSTKQTRRRDAERVAVKLAVELEKVHSPFDSRMVFNTPKICGGIR